MANRKRNFRERTGGFFDEFKQFIARGNVLDMAVGVIIGGAFGKISTSLVNDIIMPALSLLTGGIHFDDWKLILREAVVEDGEVVSEAVSINYGSLLSTVLDFLIVAFAVFLLIKLLNSASRRAAKLARVRKEEEQKAEEEKPSKEEQLLTEIRDLLKAGTGGGPQSGGQGKKTGKKK